MSFIQKIMRRYKILGWIVLNNCIGESGQRLIGSGGSDSARYCYSVWMRHLVTGYQLGKWCSIPAVVAEIGPGGSLGTGYAALLSGALQYFALDTLNYFHLEKNLRLYEEIVDLFKRRENIPDDEEFPRIIPRLDSYLFPEHIISDSDLCLLLSEDRLKKIRSCIASVNSSNKVIHYYAPWSDHSVIGEKSVDFIFSQAVLEHIDDLSFIYESMNKWLNDDGLMAHTIDFSSHGTAMEWNGHWSYSDLTWRFIRGRAKYLINREPLSIHLQKIKETGFDLIYLEAVTRDDGIDHEKCAKKFIDLSKTDLNTSGVYIACRNRL